MARMARLRVRWGSHGRSVTSLLGSTTGQKCAEPDRPDRRRTDLPPAQARPVRPRAPRGAAAGPRLHEPLLSRPLLPPDRTLLADVPARRAVRLGFDTATEVGLLA